MPESSLTDKTTSSASVRIFGFRLNFEKISQALGIKPSHTHRAGEPDFHQKPHVSDLWLLDSPLPDTQPMDAHIEWLRGFLAPHYSFLCELKEDTQIRSYCGFTANERGSFRLSPENLSLFTQLAVDIEIGLVFLGPADSSAQKPGLTDSTRVEVAEAEHCGYSANSEVAFHVVGAGLDLRGISAELGLDPSSTHRVGETDPSGFPYPTDSWSLVAPLPRREVLDAHFRWLAMALLPHSGLLRSLKNQAELLILCDFGTRSYTGGVSVSPVGLRVCTELGIPLEFNAFLI